MGEGGQHDTEWAPGGARKARNSGAERAHRFLSTGIEHPLYELPEEITGRIRDLVISRRRGIAGHDENHWGHLLSQADLDRFATVASWLPSSGATLLDVRTGTGIIPDVAARLGFDAMGVDTDAGGHGSDGRDGIATPGGECCGHAPRCELRFAEFGTSGACAPPFERSLASRGNAGGRSPTTSALRVSGCPRASRAHAQAHRW